MAMPIAANQAFSEHSVSLAQFNRLSAPQREGIAAIVGRIVSPTPSVELTVGSHLPVGRLTIKREEMTPSGSFKIRGAAYTLHCIKMQFPGKIPPLFAASTGNHGISLALIGQALGMPITVVAPKSIPAVKQAKLRKLGVDLVVRGNYLDDALETAKHLAQARGGLFIDSTDHRLVLGHATLGLELFAAAAAQAKPLDYVFFPIGAGAGISGVCLARNWLSPQTKLIGVVPQACASWHKSMQAGTPVFSAPGDTLADGLKTARPEKQLFAFLSTHLDGMVTVDEDDISQAIAMTSARLGVVPEGAGAVGLAGLVHMAKQGTLASAHAATVLCGSQEVALRSPIFV